MRKVRYLNGLIYGEYGGGKTWLAASAEDVPEMRDVLFIDAEAGDLVLSKRPQLDVVPISKFSQLGAIHEYLKLHCRARDMGNLEELQRLDRMVFPDGREKIPQYRTVVIDTLSEVQKYCMYQLTGVNIGVQKFSVEMTAPQFEQWHKLTEMIRLMIRTFRDLPMNVIFVASEKLPSGEGDNKVSKIMPNLPRALSQETPGFMDMVGYLKSYPSVEGNTNKTTRRLHLVAGHNYMAKNRFVGFDKAYLENPTMKEIFALTKSGIAEG